MDIDKTRRSSIVVSACKISIMRLFWLISGSWGGRGDLGAGAGWIISIENDGWVDGFWREKEGRFDAGEGEN